MQIQSILCLMFVSVLDVHVCLEFLHCCIAFVAIKLVVSSMLANSCPLKFHFGVACSGLYVVCMCGLGASFPMWPFVSIPRILWMCLGALASDFVRVLQNCFLVA